MTEVKQSRRRPRTDGSRRGAPARLAALAILVVLVASAVAAPMLVPQPPTVMMAGAELQGPSVKHPFGTDEYGRDLLSRTLFGLRLSFTVGGLSLITGGLSGIALGVVAGFYGGLAEVAIMRVIDGLLAFPAILMGIAIVAMLGSGLRNVALTIAFVQTPVFARLAHGLTLGEKHKDYVAAAIALGATPARVMARHILLNSLGPLAVQGAFALGFSVLIEASLSFLGLGIAPPEPSLGSILDASRNMMRHAFWYPLFPGAVLTLLLFALNGMADLLNDVLNPRRS